VPTAKPNGPARVAAVIAPDPHGSTILEPSVRDPTDAQLDHKIARGVPMRRQRIDNAQCFEEFCDQFSKYGDKTMTRRWSEADEISVF
jgi:hypothetical protein